MRWDRISIIGMGLLGGSLGLAVKQRKLAGEIVAFARRLETVAECEKVGAANRATLNLDEAVRDADLVVLCTPLAQMRALVKELIPVLKAGAIVTDVGSVKASVVRELSPLVAQAKAEFIGSHPMAGSEKSGLAAARADLFNDSVCVVTPTQTSSSKNVAALMEFWKAVGSGSVLKMKPEIHDDLVARSSHLPHVVAAELANYVLSPAHPKQQASLCANGFRDTTRIASGSPEMWRDIALANRENLIRVLGVFVEDLQELQLALERQDTRQIEEFFTNAKQRRDQWRARSASDSTE